VTPLLLTSFLALDAKGGVILSIYVSSKQWTWLVIIWIWNLVCNNFNIRSCETMWVWDIYLCAWCVFNYFLSAKNSFLLDWKLVVIWFSAALLKPGVSGLFPGVSRFSGHSGPGPENPDFSATDLFFSSWVHNLSWAFHLVFCCTSQAPHLSNTLLLFLLCKILALIGPLIFKIKNAHIKGEYYKSFKHSLFISYMT
jgi:hypothetical protein